jgi:hypothetical protein
MIPEVKTYIDAYEAAQTAYDKAYEESTAAYGAAVEVAKNNGLQLGYCCWVCAYEQTPLGKLLREHNEELYAARERAQNAAWARLKGSADPLVRWIAEKCEDYRYEATRVLRALPASMDELDALARENDWCGAWDAFRRQAEHAGVLPAQAAETAESEVTK